MPEQPDRLAFRRSLTIANVDSSLSSAFGTLLGGTFIVAFIKYLGGSDYWIGLFSSIPSLCGLTIIPGSILCRRYASYKRYTRPFGLTWRSMHLPWVAMPLLPLTADIRFTLMLACGTVGNLCINMVGPAYNDWLMQMTEPSSRGYYFTRRSAILVVVGAVVGVLGAGLLDLFRKAGNDLTGFTVIFGLALLCAACSAYVFEQMLDIERKVIVRANLVESLSHIAEPFRDRRFRNVIIFGFVSIAAQTFAGSFFSAYAIESLKMPYTAIQILVLLQAMGQLVTAGFWGRLMDQYGMRPIVAIAGIGIALGPALWMMTKPGQDAWNFFILFLLHFGGGVFWAAVLPGNLNILLANSPEAERSTYLGAGQTTQALAGALSPMLGAALLANLRGVMIAESAYKWVFFASVVMRLFAVLLLGGVREDGATGFRATLRGIWRTYGRS